MDSATPASTTSAGGGSADIDLTDTPSAYVSLTVPNATSTGGSASVADTSGADGIRSAGLTDLGEPGAATSGDPTSAARNTYTPPAGGKFSWQLDTAAHTLSLVYTPPPAVAAVQLNDTGSGITSISVTFSASVHFANGDAAAAFRLTNLDTGASVDLTATVSTDSSGRTVVTLTFDVGALAAGHYQLGILGSAVIGADGTALDASGTGTGNGVDYVGPTWAVGG